MFLRLGAKLRGFIISIPLSTERLQGRNATDANVETLRSVPSRCLKGQGKAMKGRSYSIC